MNLKVAARKGLGRGETIQRVISRKWGGVFRRQWLVSGLLMGAMGDLPAGPNLQVPKQQLCVLPPRNLVLGIGLR